MAFLSRNSLTRSMLARLNVLVLSDVMEAGVPRLPVNRCRPLMNAAVNKSGIICRCIALDVANLNKQMYAFAVPPVFSVNKGPAKSTPKCMNAGVSVTLGSSRSAVGGSL